MRFTQFSDLLLELAQVPESSFAPSRKFTWAARFCTFCALGQGRQRDGNIRKHALTALSGVTLLLFDRLPGRPLPSVHRDVALRNDAAFDIDRAAKTWGCRRSSFLSQRSHYAREM